VHVVAPVFIVSREEESQMQADRQKDRQTDILQWGKLSDV